MSTHCVRDVVDDGKKELKLVTWLLSYLYIGDEVLATLITRGFCSN